MVSAGESKLGTAELGAPVKDPPTTYTAHADHLHTGRRNEPARAWRFVSKNDTAGWLIGAATTLLGVVFVVIDLVYNQGKLIAPLDDVYIHLQYGAQLGRGHLFQYNTGDPISTGASSLLYALVLGSAYALGFRDHLLLPFAVSFGILCLALTAVCVYALGRRLAGTQVGIWAGLLVAVSGPLLWGATSGMEVGLVAALIASSVLFFSKEAPRGRFMRTPVLAALLALVRPEGLIFATALSGAMCWTILRRAPDGTRTRRLVRTGWALLPLAAGLGQLIFYRVATGTTAANGVQSKSYLYDLPVFYPTEFIDRTIVNFRGFLDVFGGLDTREFTFPGAIFFVVMGVAYLIVAKRAAWRPLGVAISIGLVAVLLSVSTLSSAHVHNLRYVQPFMPIFILLAVTGVYGAVHALAGGRAQRIAMHGALSTVLVFSLAAVPTWAFRLGQEAATIRETDVSVGGWIKGNLPPDAVVGVKDVGAVKYFSDQRIVDMIGLTTNNLATASNNGVGTLYEALRRLPAGQRPDYFAVYDPVPGPIMRDMRDAGIFGKAPLVTFEVNTPVPANADLIVPFRSLSVYRADWSLAGTGDLAKTPGTVRDYLNVGDLDSERSHSYTPEPAQVGMQPISVLRRVLQPDGREVVDSGRQIIGGERFTARNIVPGRPLTITSRADTKKSTPGNQVSTSPDLQILVNGTPAGTWHRSYDGSGWNEAGFTIPSDLITGSAVELELTPPQPLLSPYPDYTSFGYWFSQ